MGPLADIRVLALENYYAGNVGSLWFTRFGAEVIKIENPDGGDVLRDVGPMARRHGRRRGMSEIRTMGGKQSVALDLQHPDGLDVLWRLVEKVDVVWTNMKPSSLIKLGINAQTLKARNPNVIYTTLSGFGHDDVVPQGPFGNWTAFDLIAQGLAGLQYRADSSEPGDAPGNNGLALGDQVTALTAVLGTVLALLQRKNQGGPQRVDVAMHDTMVMLNELSLGYLSFTGKPPPRGRSGTSAPYGAYRTRDGYVNIAVGGDPIWRRLCVAIGRPELAADERFATSHGRVNHYQELDEILSGWTLERSAMGIVEIFEKATIPCAPIYRLPEVMESPQVAARHMLLTVDDPIAGPIRIVGNPIKMEGMDDRFVGIAPTLAADTRALLSSLAGLEESQIDELAKSGAIGLPALDGDRAPPRSVSVVE